MSTRRLWYEEGLKSISILYNNNLFDVFLNKERLGKILSKFLKTRQNRDCSAPVEFFLQTLQTQTKKYISYKHKLVALSSGFFQQHILSSLCPRRSHWYSPSRLTSMARRTTENGTHSSSPSAHHDSQFTTAHRPCAPSGRCSTMYREAERICQQYTTLLAK